MIKQDRPESSKASPAIRSARLMPRYGKILSAILAGTLTTALVAELAMRGVSKFSSAPKSRNHVPKREKNVFRIVTLGESTTASKFEHSGAIDWPHKLQGILNSHFENEGMQERVVIMNLARAATSSVFQVSSLWDKANELDPDIVISMIGVNDSHVVEIERSWLYRNSYLIRLLHWGKISFTCPNCQKEDFSEPELTHSAPRSAQANIAIDLGKNLITSSRFESPEQVSEIASQLEALQTRFGADQHFMNATVAMKLFGVSQAVNLDRINPKVHAQLLALADVLFKKSYREAVLLEPIFVRDYCTFLIVTGQPGCLDTVKDAHAAGIKLIPSLLTTAAKAGGTEDSKIQEIFHNSGLTFELQHKSKVLHNSFKRLQEFVQQYDVSWFAVQYPTGSTEALRFFMSDEASESSVSFFESFYLLKSPFQPKFQDVVYVSNQNFNEHVAKEGPSEYFTDMFSRSGGMNFGHTTEKGYALIANNIAEEIIKRWPQVRQRAEKRRAEHSTKNINPFSGL